MVRYPPPLGTYQKNPRAHKNKIGTSPPQKKTNTPPPIKRGIYGHGFFLQKERIFPGAHKIGAAISGPRIADKTFYGHEDFSELSSHRHTCAIPHFATCRAIVVRYPIKTSKKEFCDTIITIASIARYEKYRCWASKLSGSGFCSHPLRAPPPGDDLHRCRSAIRMHSESVNVVAVAMPWCTRLFRLLFQHIVLGGIVSYVFERKGGINITLKFLA